MTDVSIIPRASHPISRNDMVPEVLKVLYRLKSKGFQALIVGGALRDLYRGKIPRDFDVATDADISQIRSIFRNSRTIGKRFPIVHTYFGDQVVEISSLKGESQGDKYQLIKEDALRRDFTVNAIYYDLRDFKVIDPLDAVSHVKKGQVVVIGDIHERFQEDPIRLLRALKLVAKQGFSLSKPIRGYFQQHLDFVDAISAGRRYEELTRVFLDDHVKTILKLATEYGLMKRLWPQVASLKCYEDWDYFQDLQSSLPIQYQRGSFTKHTHIHLWFRLFLDSSFFKVRAGETAMRNGFLAFLGPLGMPFQGPIVDALTTLAAIQRWQGKGTMPRQKISSDGLKLVKYFSTRDANRSAETWQHILKSLDTVHGSRNARGRGKGKKPVDWRKFRSAQRRKRRRSQKK